MARLLSFLPRGRACANAGNIKPDDVAEEFGDWLDVVRWNGEGHGVRDRVRGR
jgi:hypothetical protein